MPIALVCIQVVLLAASIGLGVYWGVVIFHVFRTMRRIPTAASGVGLKELRAIPEDQWPRVCIVVPAHNEAAVIATVARSIAAANYPNLGAVFALDRCTDDTERILRETIADSPRFEILTITECPSEWAGKVHAIHRGVQDSVAAKSTEILLFIDADTALHPRCVAACVALLRARDLGMLSLLSTLTCDKWFEYAVQTAAGMELARQYPIERANAVQHRRAFANGQFIMFARPAYDALGGHESVKNALLEDMDLARLCERRAVRAGLFLADGMHTCRMYANWADFRRGWKRIYTECANRRIQRLRALSRRSRAVGAALPGLALCAVVGGYLFGGLSPTQPLAMACMVFGTLGTVIYAAALGACYQISRTPSVAAIFHPIGAWLVGSILGEAASDLAKNRPTVWAGREYQRDAR